MLVTYDGDNDIDDQLIYLNMQLLSILPKKEIALITYWGDFLNDFQISDDHIVH